MFHLKGRLIINILWRIFHVKRYEYKVVAIATALTVSIKQHEKVAKEFEEQLNELGANGW